MEAVARNRVADRGQRTERSHEARVRAWARWSRVLHGSFQFFDVGPPPGCERRHATRSSIRKPDREMSFYIYDIARTVPEPPPRALSPRAGGSRRLYQTRSHMGVRRSQQKHRERSNGRLSVVGRGRPSISSRNALSAPGPFFCILPLRLGMR